MGKLSIPQQVKIASASVTLAASVGSTKIPIEMGDNEIALLLASKVMVYTDADQAADMRLCLYRKTENVPTDAGFLSTVGRWQTDSAVLDIWLCLFDTTRTSEWAEYSKWIYQVYPYPYVLIRQPSIVHFGTAQNVYAAITLWYLTERVTDAELTQLMVKDHD